MADWFFSGNAFKTKGDLSVVEDARVMYVIYYQPPGSEFGEDLGFSLDTSKLLMVVCGRRVLIWF